MERSGGGREGTALIFVWTFTNYCDSHCVTNHDFFCVGVMYSGEYDVCEL
jgi:hypothetical protein